MNIPRSDSPLLIQGSSSFIILIQVRKPFTLYIETMTDEYCQYLSSGDLVAVSAPEGGEIRQAEILLELITRWHAPLMVLPAGHPGSNRLNMVISAGGIIHLSCSIQRGTHPEQTVLCSSEELGGMYLTACEDGVHIEHLPESATLYQILSDGTHVRLPDLLD